MNQNLKLQRRFIMWSLVLFVASLSLACGPESREDFEGNETNPEEGTPNWEPPMIDPGTGGGSETRQVCEKMDLLFVIDDSGSMYEEQQNLAANFPQFVDVLNNYDLPSGRKLNYRIGVTTTGRTMSWKVENIIPGFPASPMDEKGADGALQTGNSCNIGEKWIDSTDGDVAEAFSCMANVGTKGPASEMPLYAAKLALGDRIADGTNAGFLRDDALLGIIILTDEDDCSREDNNFTVPFSDIEPCAAGQPKQDVSRYIDFFDQLTGDRKRWATAVIAGPGPGPCSSDFGDAVEATRLKDFVNQVGDYGIFSSICEGDLAIALGNALDTMDAACQDFPPIK